VLITDTVGFIQRLPTGLVEAFKSTLEEVAEADLLLHVVDGSGSDPEAQMEAVRSVLREIGAGDVPEFTVFNKVDQLDEGGIDHLLRHHEGSLGVSARTGAGLDRLLASIGDRLRSLTQVVELLIPWSRGDILAATHREGEVLLEQHEEDGTRIQARLDEVSQSLLSDFIVRDVAGRVG
jgi:GTP-binding protein HflX